jgi:pheromone shutdown protein TraB
MYQDKSASFLPLVKKANAPVSIEAEPTDVQVPDNRSLAVIAMNFYLVSTTFVVILFKKMNSEVGLAVFDWFFIKGVFSLASTIILSKQI